MDLLKKILAMVLFATVGLVSVLGYGAIAQTPRTTPVQTRSLNNIDRQFVNEAGQAAIGNIMLGQLALQRATSDDAKKFA